METGSTPPPLPTGPTYPPQAPYPPQAMPYATPVQGAQRTPAAGELGEAQKVFDTVAGPNVRVKDNLIQLACVVFGAGAGAVVGWTYGPPGVGVLIGVTVGLFVSLVLSGVVIGIVRFFTAVRKK